VEPDTLILFDIDLTLLSTGGAGLNAMCEAGVRVFGRRLERRGVEFAGRLDPLILRELIASNGFDPTPDAMGDLRAAYAEMLPGFLHATEALPGTHALVDRLEREAGVTLGVLTGNFPETGRLKLAAAGFDPGRFTVCAWGDDSPHEPPAREHLPPVAMDRFRHATGAPPRETLIIGDTPHDVACALANGCRVLAVATGYTDAESLRRAGAHRVASDLSDTPAVLGWVLGEGSAPSRDGDEAI
jgi:phosphoglycolate phosphatase-like HAD superfamily hydrolase